MRSQKIFAALLAGTSVLVLAQFSLGQEMLYLAPLSDVHAYSRTNWSHQDPPDQVLAVGSATPITGCVIPDKTDVLIAVAIDGRAYYVTAGYYTILRRRATVSEAWLDPLATSSCKGMFSSIPGQAPNNSFKPKPLRGSA